MAQPIVQGDRAQAQCAAHMIPNPATGAPQPSPPLPFSAPLLTGLATSVTIGGKPAAVVGSGGMNTPPHVGLHPADPFFAPPAQIAQIVSGDPSVLIEGRPAATSDSQAVCCGIPGGTCLPTSTDVTIG
jgi:uncharacterized Zn-binding protein involved in type VI secretion